MVPRRMTGFLVRILGNPRLGLSVFSRIAHKNRENERSSE